MKEVYEALENVIVYVNGQPVEYDGTSLYEFLKKLGVEPESKNIAVAINYEVVARYRWKEVKLSKSDKIELVHAVAGG